MQKHCPFRMLAKLHLNTNSRGAALLERNEKRQK